MQRPAHSASASDASLLAFGEFRLDLAGQCLRRGDEIVALRPKTWAVLRLLAERAGQLVTTRELLDAVWAETAVTPNVLTNVIGELRAALDDRTQPARFVRTVHRRGYRFVAEVRVATVTAPPVAETPDPPTPEQGRPGPTSIPDAPIFVGRDAELEVLHEEWRRAAAGERRLAFVAGAPGIGKSTLVDAFVARALDAVSGDPAPVVARVQCVERSGTAEPYLPLLDALEQLGTGPRRSALRAALRRHAPAWLAHLPWLATGAELQALQRSLAGSGEARMAREGSRLLEALAARQPLLLILEDLHWSDASTLSVLTALAGRPSPARLLVLGTYRPIDAVVEGHPIVPLVRELRQRTQATELALAPFAVHDLVAYLERRFASRDLAARLAPLLEEQSGGNPLFLSALVAHLVAQGVLRRHGSAWGLHGDLDGEVSLPVDLREAIARQWAKLEPRTRDMLDAASVDGVEFAVDAVAAGIGATTDEVEDLCHALAGAGRLLPVGDTRTRRPGARAVRYRFPHALHRRVLYDRLAPSRRREIHRRIGEHLERTATGSDGAARLLMHFEAAGDEQRSARYVEQVAWNAMARHAYGVAAQGFGSAIEHLQRRTGDDAARAHEALLQLILGNALLMSDGYTSPPVRDAFAASEGLAREAGLHELRFRALIGLGTVALAAGDPLRAEPFAEQMAAIVAGEAPELAAQSLWRSGVVQLEKGELASARALLERAARTEAAPGIPFGTDLQVDIQGLLGATLCQLGLLDEGRAAFARALQRADEVELPFSYGQARALAAEGCILRREPDELLVLIDEAAVWMERYAFPSARAMEGFYRHWALHRHAPGIEHARGMHEALRGKNALGEHWHDSIHLAEIAAAYLDCGDANAARSCIDAAFAHAARTGERCHEAELHRTDAELRLVAAGSPRRCDAAEAAFERAIAVARAHGAVLWELRATVGLARLLARRDAASTAAGRLARVLDTFSEGADTTDLRVARAALAELR
ncbi:AAA family ATPase [Candidatus Binatia bacterium]|nr:AAA family ATPase [Candidatus Binatia bacterium]